MLSDITPVATLPTADMARARGFYERTLGLTPQREGMGGVSYACGDGTVFVYESQYAYGVANGGTWLNPTTILGPRFVRLNFTFNF